MSEYVGETLDNIIEAFENIERILQGQHIRLTNLEKAHEELNTVVTQLCLNLGVNRE